METEYSSYRLGLTLKRANWLVHWLREIVKNGSVTARDMSQGLGRLGFAARLGKALSRPSVCLVLCDTGEDRPHEATRDAEGLDGLASRSI